MGVQEPGLLVFDFSTGSKISLMTVYCHGDCIFPSLFLLLLLSLQRINAVIIVIQGGGGDFVYSLLIRNTTVCWYQQLKAI